MIMKASLVDEISGTSLFALTAFILTLVYITVSIKSRKTSFPASTYPPSLGLFKTLWLLYRSGLPLYELGRQLGYKYGEIYMINLFGRKVVFLTDFPLIKEAFSNSSLLARPYLEVNNQLRKQVADNDDTQHGVILTSGERWNQERRFILEIFKKFGIGRSKFEDQIENESKCLIEEITQLKGEQFDPNHVLVNAVSNVIVSVIFGKRYEYSDERFKYFLKLGTRQTKDIITNILFVFLPFLAHLPFIKKVYTDMENAGLELHAFVGGIIKNHKRDLDTEIHRDLIDAYLSELRFNENGSGGKLSMLTEFSLTVTIKQMFIAGTDTTALTLR
ncbi:cytochrome P450 2J4-like [Amphiura filiformis]|uniref:cytochrome P450 2J4-like n=1 Tax=Amphiura filiformis TaxID=82378 RepID=UPI003B21F54A